MDNQKPSLQLESGKLYKRLCVRAEAIKRYKENAQKASNIQEKTMWLEHLIQQHEIYSSELTDYLGLMMQDAWKSLDHYGELVNSLSLQLSEISNQLNKERSENREFIQSLEALENTKPKEALQEIMEHSTERKKEVKVLAH